MSIVSPKKSLIAAAVSTAALSMSFGVGAAEAKAQQEVTEIAPIVVTASRTEKSIYEAPASIAVVDQTAMKETQPQTITEALDAIPNVEVSGLMNPLSARVSIRGSEANQITYLIDGVRQDNYTSSGNRPNGFFIDPEMVKQIEVRRGGGSSLYGNGGIGGTVALETKTAADFLTGDRDFGATVKAGYSDGNKEWTESAYLYGRHNALDVVMAYTHRDGSEAKTSRTGERNKTPFESESDSFMAKATLGIGLDSVAALTYNYDTYSSDNGYPGDVDSYDHTQHRITGSWDYNPNDLVDFAAKIQFTQSDTQYSSAMPNDFDDDFKSLSVNLQNTSRFKAGLDHILTYGFDMASTEQKSKAVEQGTPDTTRPDSEGWDSGIFIQDEIVINQYVTATPVLRYSHYDRQSNLGAPDQSDSQVSPGFTLTVTPLEGLSVYGSVNSGYRPPILDELYYSMLTPPDMGITHKILANPDLKAEESVNYEIGTNAVFGNLMAEGDSLSVKGALFYDEVDNYIQSRLIDQDRSVWTWQTQNVKDVERKGVELSADYSIGNADFQAAYGMVHARNKATDKRLEGVSPQSFSLRTAYTLPAYNLSGWYRFRWNDGAVSSATDKTEDSWFTHAVGLNWEPTVAGMVDLSAQLTIENLTDEEYRYANGTYGYGRTVRASLTARF